MDLPELYHQIVRSRLFEIAVADLWNQGRISAEMHLGTGEEAIVAGVVTHLRDGDGLAAAHRSSPPFIVRGVPIVPILRELLGEQDGLCHGQGGHMHLHSKPHLAAASGIVGASVPTAAGFALSAQRLSTGSIGVAFTGTGAMNAGIVLETMNLAAAWNLPLVVVCIDNGWAITTPSSDVTGGSLTDRAAAFGWRTETADGRDVESIHAVTRRLIEHTRSGGGPAFLSTRCPRLDGHFLGDPLLRLARHPIKDGLNTTRQIAAAVIRGPGAPRGDRMANIRSVLTALRRARAEPARGDPDDPLMAAAAAMDRRGFDRTRIEHGAEDEIAAAVIAALNGTGHDDA